MKYLIYAAAVVAALLTVLSTRLIIPALIIVYRAIEQSFAPQEPALVPVLAAATEPAVEVTKAAPKKRVTRKRTTSTANVRAAKTKAVTPIAVAEGFA